MFSRSGEAFLSDDIDFFFGCSTGDAVLSPNNLICHSSASFPCRTTSPRPRGFGSFSLRRVSNRSPDRVVPSRLSLRLPPPDPPGAVGCENVPRRSGVSAVALGAYRGRHGGLRATQGSVRGLLGAAGRIRGADAAPSFRRAGDESGTRWVRRGAASLFLRSVDGRTGTMNDARRRGCCREIFLLLQVCIRYDVCMDGSADIVYPQPRTAAPDLYPHYLAKTYFLN